MLVWEDWRLARKITCGEYPPPPLFCTVEALNNWLCKFVLEARRKDGEAYPPNTLYSICSGIQRHVRELCPEILLKTQNLMVSEKLLTQK